MSSMDRKEFLGKAAQAAGALAAGGVLLGSEVSGAEAHAEEAPEVIYRGEVFDSGGATLNMANWGGTWQTDNFGLLLDKFEKDFNCKINYDPNFPYYPKLVAGGMDNPPYDVLNQNLPEATQSERFYVSKAEIMANVPNTKQLWPFAFYGTGIIWQFSIYGYAYRTDLVKGPAPTGFKAIWEDRFKGKRGLYDTTNTLEYVFFMVASQVFGGNPENIQAGINAMKAGKPWVVSHFTQNMQQSLTTGEVEIAVLDDGEVFELIDKGVKVLWVPWTERKPILEQNLSVTKGSKNKRLAYALLNRYCEAGFQSAFSKKYYFRPTNRSAIIPSNLASKGVKNTAHAIAGLWVPDWNWWNNNQQQILGQLNSIL